MAFSSGCLHMAVSQDISHWRKAVLSPCNITLNNDICRDSTPKWVSVWGSRWTQMLWDTAELSMKDILPGDRVWHIVAADKACLESNATFPGFQEFDLGYLALTSTALNVTFSGSECVWFGLSCLNIHCLFFLTGWLIILWHFPMREKKLEFTFGVGRLPGDIHIHLEFGLLFSK